MDLIVLESEGGDHWIEVMRCEGFAVDRLDSFTWEVAGKECVRVEYRVDSEPAGVPIRLPNLLPLGQVEAETGRRQAWWVVTYRRPSSA